MAEDVFQRYSRYYDLLYADKDYEAEAAYVARVLREANAATGRVLELGSGTGRHGRLLASHGFEVFGVERSESMVGVARQGAGGGSTGFDCMQGDIRHVELGRRFDAV